MTRHETRQKEQIGRLFTSLLCITGSSLVGVFMAKLISQSLDIAFTDFALLALGSAMILIGAKFDFNNFIFSSGGEHRVNHLFFKIGSSLLVFLIAIKILAGETSSYRRSLEEGGIVEWATFLLLLISAYMLFCCAKTVHSGLFRVIYYILSGISFVIGMEEMSWGQMIFNWKTPSPLALINDQGETNLHNIGFISSHSDLAYGLILALIVFVTLAADRQTKQIKNQNFYTALLELAPSKMLLIYFVPASIFSLCLYFNIHEFAHGFILRGEEELMEMIGAFGLLGYSTSMISRLKEMQLNKDTSMYRNIDPG